jgi:hypothetical protein
MLRCDPDAGVLMLVLMALMALLMALSDDGVIRVTSQHLTFEIGLGFQQKESHQGHISTFNI